MPIIICNVEDVIIFIVKFAERNFLTNVPAQRNMIDTAMKLIPYTTITLAMQDFVKPDENPHIFQRKFSLAMRRGKSSS